MPVFGPEGGITFGVAAPILCQVCDNGITYDDPRVMVRTNEATKLILDNLIPVGGYATYDVIGQGPNGNTLLLPPQLENAIEHEIVDGSGWAEQTDVVEGWYNLVNPYAYLEPDEYMGLILIDQGLVPDPNDQTLLRRQYQYPGIDPGARVRITGAKRFIPIKLNSDYLIVQNIEALKLMIISIERYENNAFDDGKKYRQEALELLQVEAKKHILDPMQHSKRLALFDQDIATFAYESFGWTRGMIAREVPGVAHHGKDYIGYILQMAERRLLEKGFWKGSLVKIDAYVMGGYLYFPPNIQAVVAVDIGAEPLDLRSTFIEYMKNGPAKFSVHRVLIDRGEVYFPEDQTKRRKYKLVSDQLNTDILSTICKVRWMPKTNPKAQMQLKNYEALRLEFTAIMEEHDAAAMRKQLKFQEASALEQSALANEQKAVDVLEKELREYLGGIQHTLRVQDYGFGLGSVGQMTL